MNKKMKIFKEVTNCGGYQEERYSLLREKKMLIFFSAKYADFKICVACGRISNHMFCCDLPKWVTAKHLLIHGEEVDLESLPHGIQDYIHNL